MSLAPETRLVCSDDVFVESCGESGVVLAHRASSARLQVSTAAHNFLLRFTSARRLGDVADVPLPGAVIRVASLFMARGMLQDADDPAPAMRPDRLPVPLRFSGAPAFGKTGQSDIVVLGIPYDLGASRGCRSAPSVIRKRSQDFAYEGNIRDGRPRGWFDADREERILEGISVSDAGDLRVSTVEDRRAFEQRAAAAVRDLAGSGALPLVLAGDESCAPPVAEALGAGLSVLGAAGGTKPGEAYVLVIDLSAHAGRWNASSTGELERLKALLHAIEAPFDIGAVVLTGPTEEERGTFTALIACHLLLTAADVITRARKKSHG